MKDHEKNPMMESFDTTLKGYEQVLHSGFKAQHEAWQSWASLLNQGMSAKGWAKDFPDLGTGTNGLMPPIQERIGELLELAEKSSANGVELLRKAAEAAQASGTADYQARWMEFWKTSIGAAQSATEALLHINAKAFDSWASSMLKAGNRNDGRAAKGA